MSDLSRGVFKVEALADLGCVTPRTAVESFLWAIAHGTNDDIAAMLGLTENQKRLLNETLAELPPETRAQYPDPEHLVALYGAREGTIIPASGTVQITSETIAASNEVQIRAHITTGAEQYKDSGLVPNNTSSFNVRNGPTGWKIIVPDYAIEQIIPRIIPKPQVGG
ncbi:MAG TPA: hypothetical protein VFT72_08225 [Opitutaceae bacterium]|nr:hypothetical protein [Opitutaceae bacterium]